MIVKYFVLESWIRLRLRISHTSGRDSLCGSDKLMLENILCPEPLKIINSLCLFTLGLCWTFYFYFSFIF